MSKKQESILISVGMFEDLKQLMWHLSNQGLNPELRKLCNRIDSQIDAKLQAMERRGVYGKVVASGSEAERQAAMQQYHDVKAKHHGFRQK